MRGRVEAGSWSVRCAPYRTGRVLGPRVLAIGLAVWFAACDAGASDGGATFDGAVERDSAGVTIVESRVPLWAEDDGWTVDPRPVLQIGQLSGDPDYQLFRITGAVRLSDGALAVATGDPAVRFYDAEGTFLRAVGRDGDGPGEFRALGSLQRLSGDTLFAWDARLRRGTVITPDGEALSSDPFPRGVPISGIVRGPDGTYFGTASVGDTALTRADGHARWSVRRLHRIREANPPVVDTLMQYRTTEGYVANPQPQGGPPSVVEGAPVLRLSEVVVAGSTNSRFIRLPLARSGVFTISGHRLFVGTNDRVMFEEYAADGTLLRSVRVPGMDRPVTPEVRDSVRAFLDDWTETEVEEERLAEILDRVDFPEILPAYSAIHLSSDGYFWLAPYEHPGFEPEERLASRWTVLDPVGRWLGSVELPAHFTPLEFGADYILGVWRDEYEVEYLQMLRITR